MPAVPEQPRADDRPVTRPAPPDQGVPTRRPGGRTARLAERAVRDATWVAAVLAAVGGVADLGAWGQPPAAPKSPEPQPTPIAGDQPFQWTPTPPVAPPADPAAGPPPPIPIHFTLKEPGFVTLVVEDADGRRVRNLVSEAPFPAGPNVVHWDGLAEEFVNVRVVGIHDTLGRVVEPGKYRVRGLYRRALGLRYETAVYNAGDPPWPNRDGTGRWAADHTPPSAVLFLPPGRAPHLGRYANGQQQASPTELFIPTDRPLVLVVSQVAESGDGLVWCDLDGKKVRGVRSYGVGGGWCGATMLARDDGQRPAAGVYAYNGTAWKNWVDVRSMPDNARVYYEVFKSEAEAVSDGIAARDGLLVVSLRNRGEVAFVDAAARKKLGTAKVADPRGVAFDADGRLLVLSGKRLLRFPRPNPARTTLGEPTVLNADALDDPRGLALAADDTVYVSDQGAAHDVKVFDAAGRLLRTVGTPGGMRLGAYDETRMHRPNGITVDSEGRLWVAENSYGPKRVSVWGADGKLVRAMYGPPGYGGGGSVDPGDPSRFYLAHGGYGMEFRVDWATGGSKLAGIYFDHDKLPGDVPGLKSDWHSAPQYPIRHGGRLYLTNCFTGSPGSLQTVGLWELRGGLAHPVAAVGCAENWEIFRQPGYKEKLPAGKPVRSVFFAWSDLNGDGRPQPDEVTVRHLDWKGSRMNGAGVGPVYLGPDLTVTTSGSFVMRPRRFTPAGVPVYDVADATKTVPDLRYGWVPYECVTAGEWTVAKAEPMRGYRDGKLVWTYPNRWPELHACLHDDPPVPKPGQLVGTTRLQGQPVTPPRGEAGPLLAFTGYYGQTYLMTVDGLFVASLFRDSREMGYFNAFSMLPPAARGIEMGAASMQQECFFDTITVTADGRVLLQAGKSFCGLVRLDGLETVRRIPAFDLDLTPDHVRAVTDHLDRLATARVRTGGPGDANELIVARPARAPAVDGKLDDWPKAGGPGWANARDPFVRTGRAATAYQEDTASFALAASGGRLFVAVKTTGGAKPLDTRGKDWTEWLAAGGLIDLQLGLDAAAPAARTRPAKGDVRLLVTRVEGKPAAVVVRGDDTATDVTANLAMAGEKGAYEFSLPLADLGLTATPGTAVRGDVGVVWPAESFDGRRVPHPVYWHNRGSGYVAAPDRRRTTNPALWGTVRFAQ